MSEWKVKKGPRTAQIAQDVLRTIFGKDSGEDRPRSRGQRDNPLQYGSVIAERERVTCPNRWKVASRTALQREHVACETLDGTNWKEIALFALPIGRHVPHILHNPCRERHSRYAWAHAHRTSAAPASCSTAAVVACWTLMLVRRWRGRVTKHPQDAQTVTGRRSEWWPRRGGMDALDMTYEHLQPMVANALHARRLFAFCNAQAWRS